jgi:hypothetical protein
MQNVVASLAQQCKRREPEACVLPSRKRVKVEVFSSMDRIRVLHGFGDEIGAVGCGSSFVVCT